MGNQLQRALRTSAFRIDAWKNTPAYWEAYCSVFLGETPPIAKTAQDEAAIAKGLEDGKTLLPRRKVVFLSAERRRRRRLAHAHS